MANYHYSSTDGSNFKFKGEVAEIPQNYIEYEGKSFGASTLYYITEDGKLTDIIAESVGTESYARNEIIENLKLVKSIV